MRDEFPVYVPAAGGIDVETGDLRCVKFYSQEPDSRILRSIAEWLDENDVSIENLSWRTDFVFVDPTRNHPDDEIMPVTTVVLYYQEDRQVDPNDPGPVRYIPWS
ncbi:MAG: hypothetical protein LC808_24260 [Actinobacteria bacterium]|nr:hypothetical protein [Actinomycetota bacterium]